MASEPDLLIEAGFSDAKLAAEVNKIVAKYRQAGEAAQKAFQGSADKVADSQAAKAHVRELEALKRAYDPVYVATQKYEAGLKKLDRALELGAIDQRRYTAEVKKAQTALAQASSGLGDQTEAVVGKSRRMGGQLQQAGFQIGDWATQVGAGTSATQALGQQLPQLLGAFGAFGAIAGATTAVLIPLGAALARTAFDSQSLEERMKDLERSTDAMADAAEAASAPLSDLQSRYGGLAAAINDANQAAALFTRIQAEHDLLGAAGAVGSEYVLPDAPSLPRSGTGDYAGVQADLTRAALQAQAAAARKLREDLGASAEQAEALQQAFRRLNTANGPEAAARDAANLQRVLAEVASTAGVTKDQLANLSTLAAQAGAVRAQAERQIMAAQTEAQRVIDKYAGTTRELTQLSDDRRAAEIALAKAQAEGNAALVTDLQEVIANIDQQIEKTSELARETDAAFQAMSRSIREGFGSALASGFERIFGTDPTTFGREVEAANKGLRELIKLKESGGDYNVTLDHGAYTGGPVNLTSMTINEVLALQKRMLAHPDNTRNSSAAGAYQIVRKTLESLVRELGLTGNELYDPAMQDRLADQLIRRRRPEGNAGLRREWEGLGAVSDAVLNRARGMGDATSVDPEVARNRQKALDDEIAARKKNEEAVRAYGAQLAQTLGLEQKQAELRAQAAQQIAAIEASGMDDRDKAAAIAAVNAEMDKQLLIYGLLEDAKRRNLDVDQLVTGEAGKQLAALLGLAEGTFTYRDAINALGDAQRARALADQQAAKSTGELSEAQQFAADQQQQLKDGFIDAIVAGKDFGEVLKQVAQNLAKAALQAALFGEGPFAGKNSGGGLLGSLFGGLLGGGGVRVTGSDVLSGALRGAIGGSYEGGGYTGAGARMGGLDGKGGFLTMLHPQETVLDHTRGQGRAVSFAPSTSIVVQGSMDRDAEARLMRELDRRDARMAKALPAIIADKQARGMMGR